MKKIAITIMSVIAILAMMVSLTGCTEDDTTTTTTKNDFSKVGSYTLDANNEVFVYYDSDTKVMYQFIDGYKAGASIVMYNADETMATYDMSTNVNEYIKLVSKTSISTNNTVYKYYDTVTKVLYQYVDGYECCGVTVMRNPDGTIATYSE